MFDFIDEKRAALIHHLRRHLQGEVRFDATSRRLYSTDASIYQIEPLGVVIPRTREDLHAAVQIALEMHIPLVPRGGGTSLSGQSIGPGVVLDCSKYLNHILELDPEQRRARVEPGVVLQQLNTAAAAHGLQFGPNVATHTRANLGGMIGNNSAGSHSIVYGKTIDHVRGLRVLLGDGSSADLRPQSAEGWQAQERTGFLGSLYRQVRQIAHEVKDEIEARFPKILRRVSGYNLDVFVHPGGRPVGLHQLLVGSEGTLGVIAEAELNLVPRPKHLGLLIPQFTSLSAAMDALDACMRLQPSAIELLDHMLLDLAGRNLALRSTMAYLTGVPQALFMVEFAGDDEAEVADKVRRLQRRLSGTPGLIESLSVLDHPVRTKLWNLRNASMPLLLGMPGDRKPVTFVEDTAVPPEHLPRFVARFREILRRHGTDGAFYGHASVGCLHIRPLLDLKLGEDVYRMRRITEDITDLVLEFGGSLSGEHGDGLARSEWNRKMFGETLYDAFRRIKSAFDPGNLLNPGKIVDAPLMTENLRYGPNYHAAEPETILDYQRQEGFARSIELCNGAGACRKLEGGTMCPSYRATRDEADSTRGRANLLRLALASDAPLERLAGHEVQQVLDLCLMCKACKSECPSNVDMAKLKAEAVELHYRTRPRPVLDRLVGNLHQGLQWASLGAPLVNLLQRNPVLRWLAERWVGIDRRRRLPALHAQHFRRWFASRRPRPSTLAKVLLLDDCFTTFSDPAIGKAAVRVLEAAGWQVQLAGASCCGRTLISRGMLTEARALVQAQAPVLAAQLDDETPILGVEPSCLLTLTDEWPELLPGAATARVARAARLAEQWLDEQIKLQRTALPLEPLEGVCVVHGHCHQKALVGMDATRDLLRQVPGLDVRVLDTGCCGMAGAFGYEKAHYDLSVAIARQDLLPRLEEHADAVVVASGTSCRQQIHDLTPRRALHPLEVIANRLPKESP